MLDKIFEWLKEFLKGETPFLRKLRILRYVTCIIILFIAFCDLYWNVLAYIDLPCAPLLDDKFREVMHSSIVAVFICWILYSAFWGNICRIFDGKYVRIVLYILDLFDFLFTVYFLAYVINIAIEYANGLQVEIRIQTIFSIVYLTYFALHTSYILHQQSYAKRAMRYTHYCDSEGVPIPVGANVFYNGKEYRIVEYEGIYRIISYDDRLISSGLISLEDAASDSNGKLYLKK